MKEEKRNAKNKKPNFAKREKKEEKKKPYFLY